MMLFTEGGGAPAGNISCLQEILQKLSQVGKIEARRAEDFFLLDLVSREAAQPDQKNDEHLQVAKRRSKCEDRNFFRYMYNVEGTKCRKHYTYIYKK